MTTSAISPTTQSPTTSAPTDATDPPGGAATDPGSGALLPEPVAIPGGECSFAALAMLLTQADEQDRRTSRQTEDAADQAAAQQDSARVAEMREKANDEENAAIAQGLGEIASGVCTVGGGVANSDTGKAEWNGVAKASDGAGNLVGGMFKGDAGMRDADAAAAEAQSQADLRRSSQAHEDVQAANASLDKVEQFLDQITQTQNATRLAAVSVRG